MARPKRDPKTGKFVKRNAKRRANKTTVRRKNRGLKGHKPGCKCVIHARRRAVANRGKRRRVTPNRKRTRRNQQRYGSVRSGVTSREAQKYSTAGRQIGAEVWLNAQETRLLKSHGIAGQTISDDAVETARRTAREIKQHVAIVLHSGSVYKIINPSGTVLFGPYR